MNSNFSIKLFFAFLIFGLLLFFSSFFLSYIILNKKFHMENIKVFSNHVDENQKELEELIKHQKFLLRNIYNFDSFKNFDKKVLSEKLSIMLLSNTELKEISIFEKDSGKELIKQRKEYGEIIHETKYFDTLNDFDIFSDILKLEPKQIYYSSIKLNKNDAEIVNPLEPIIYMSIKDKSYIIIMKVSAAWILEAFSSSDYILDANKNIIYDKTKKYSWSKYFQSGLNIKEVIKESVDYLFTNNFSVTNNYLYKRLDIFGDKYLNVITSNRNFTFSEFIHKYKESIYAIAFISFILAFILATLFTTPLSNINKKLQSEKNQLNDSFEKNNLILSDSLQLIDQYVMYLKFDKNWNILEVSNYFCKISGFQREELLGHNYKRLLNNKTYEEFLKAKEFLKQNKLWSGDLVNVKKNGIEHWIRSQIEVNYDLDGKVLSYTEIKTDIDDKKRIENLYNDLNYQIEQLNVIFQNANSGIALIDINGNFKNINNAFVNIFQYDEKELYDENFFALVDASSENLLNEVLLELKELDSISNVELIFLTKNSEEIYLDVSLRILPDKNNIVLVINSLEDKRKLQELNQTLEQRVFEEVKKSMEKDKFHQEQQIKNAKLTSIGTLAAGITHEINTPLTYLKGNFELLQMDLEDLPESGVKKEMKEGCEKIDEAINRIAVIVESMREMSQSSTVAKEKTNIYSTLITSLTMAYNVSKQVSKIYLNGELFTITNIDKNKFHVFADVQKQRIEQVWIIIINNALDELKKIEDYDKREFKILVYEQEDEVIIKFKDNAGGIKEDIIDKIFDPFTSTKQHSGMGVGLNIAKKIIDEQSGSILAYNEDVGAVFEVRLKKLAL